MRFKPRKLPARNAAAYVEQSIAEAPHRYEASVTLEVPASEIEGRLPSYFGGTLDRIDDRRCRYRTGDDDLAWLAMRIAMLGVDFVVDEPPELIEHFRALAARLERAAA